MAESDRLTQAEERAAAILGRRNILTRVQAHGAVELPVRYSEATLHTCAGENERDEDRRDWRLVYLSGSSLREEHRRVGVDPEHQPCFANTNWLVGAWIGGWLRRVPEKFEPGYYLIDLAARFGRTSWPRQEQAIRKLGPQVRRAHEAMVTEAALRIFEATGERPLFCCYHWGYSVDYLSNRVHVGLFQGDGWVVDYCSPLWEENDLLRVCLVRTFET